MLGAGGSGKAKADPAAKRGKALDQCVCTGGVHWFALCAVHRNVQRTLITWAIDDSGWHSGCPITVITVVGLQPCNACHDGALYFNNCDVGILFGALGAISSSLRQLFVDWWSPLSLCVCEKKKVKQD